MKEAMRDQRICEMKAGCGCFEMKVGLISLGCPKNLVDSEVMLGMLARAGHAIVSRAEEAEAMIVNTCSFIGPARAEAKRTVREMARHKGGRCRYLILAGCLTRHGSSDLRREFPQVDAFVGLGEFTGIARLLQRLEEGEGRQFLVGRPQFLYSSRTPRVLATPPWTAYVKIAEGCDRRCAFCAIPRIKGPMRSRPAADIEREVRNLIARGVKETVLVAQDTTAYGRDLFGRPALADLVRRLARLDGMGWLRVMYWYPGREAMRAARVMADEPAVVRYIDLPLQHASAPVLRAMRRPGGGERYLEMIAKLRALVPGVAIRTSLLVGFPGERERDFAVLLEFVREARFDRLGVFTYSREEGTPAHALDSQVPAQVARERRRRLMALQREISLQINQALVGRHLQVLIEREAGRAFVGRCYRDAPEIDGLVRVSGRALAVGEFADAIVTRAHRYDLVGRAAAEGESASSKPSGGRRACRN
jgi:ribosomal protein S12 methylthiotransferase